MKIRVISSDDLRRCPITSLEREHYRDDGTCLCKLPVLTDEQVAEAYAWADNFMQNHIRKDPK